MGQLVHRQGSSEGYVWHDILGGGWYLCYCHNVEDSSAANMRVLCVILMSISPVWFGESSGSLGTGGQVCYLGLLSCWGFFVVAPLLCG